MKHTCGHDAGILTYMGRGEARERRIGFYFSRPCFPCALDAAALRLRNRRMIDGSLPPENQVRDLLLRAFDRIYIQYL